MNAKLIGGIHPIKPASEEQVVKADELLKREGLGGVKTNRYIQTTFNPKPGNAGPPSPFRFDWEAIWSDDSSEGRHVGYGATEAEAIDDLKRLDSERAEAEEDARLSEANFPFSGSF